MTDYDITDGGRRRIVSEDQAKNLREQAEQRAELDRLLASGQGCVYYGTSTRDRFNAKFSRTGEESQDPDREWPA